MNTPYNHTYNTSAEAQRARNDAFAEACEQDKATALAEGKEPFDFALFVKLYFHDTGSCERLRPDDELSHAYYRRMYYTDYPEIRTVREFAEFLNKIESF